MDFKALTLPTGFTCIFGVDYGSKMAGTTVVAVARERQIDLLQSGRKQDADAWLLETAVAQQPDHIFLDAPLSLPGVYRHLPGRSDYFYREADRELQAMSPMFLGGLTARAMQLHERLRPHTRSVHEVYPAAVARHLQLKSRGYKGSVESLAGVLAAVVPLLPVPIKEPESINNWHQVDALLALLSGFRYCLGRHTTFGGPEEGVILV